MTDLDPIFRHLHDIAEPDALARLDARVLASIARKREQAVAQKGLALASAIALVIGASFSIVPAGEARATPLFGMPEAAPSRLLAD